jgi:exodeoxyribonuclease-5
MVNNYYNSSWLNLTKELVDKGLADKDEFQSFKEMYDSPDKENAYLAQEIIRLRIEKAYLKRLNPGQTKAFVSLVSFMKDPQDYDGAVLKGYAGTGKTYLISSVVDFMKKAYPNRKVAVTAPTNKAVKVLSNGVQFKEQGVFKTEHHTNTSVDYGTVHSILGLKESVSNTGERKFVIDDKKNKISDYRYLVVDESSMLNDELYDLIMTHKPSKLQVIFMGDPAQIPPVNQEHCLPFHDDNPDKLLKLELTEIMRQKGENPIIDLSFQIRENLEQKNPIGTIHSDVNIFDQGVLVLDSKLDRKSLRPLINELYNHPSYIKNPNFIKTIAWRNKSIDYLNSIIREEVYGKNLDRFVKGEKLIANQALFSEGEYGNMELKANTSTEFEIYNVKVQPHKFKIYEFGKKTGMFPTYVFDCEIYKISAKIEGDGKPITIRVITEEYMEAYNTFCNTLKAAAKVARNSKLWIDYYTACKFNHNVSYGYAITAHKSQGSTYENVIFIEEDVDFNKKTVERNRIKYTACTRAAEKLIMLRKNQ